MVFKNKSKRLFVGFNLAGGDPNCQKIGIPVRIEPGQKGTFEVLNRSVEIAVQAGVLGPSDKEAREWATDKKLI